jgi:UDP-N-acetylmuramate dehydrogenase
MTIHQNFPLSEILWYKIGGQAKVLLEAENKEDITQALDYIEKNHIHKLFVCGLGSNLIFTDDYFDGAVLRISTTAKLKSLPKMQDDVFVESFAGNTLDDVIRFSFDHNLIGLEWAGGLPGTVGAGVRGNVGAFGGEIKDVVADAYVLEMQSGGFNIERMTNTELAFAYRQSAIKEQRNRIILSATFQLRQADAQKVLQAREVYEKNIQYRRTNHPLEYPNCGSVFKNIKNREEVNQVLAKWPDIIESVNGKWHGKVSMGYIIKRLGFSGKRIGNAQVSEKHANFIINLGGAKAVDVVRVIREIQEKVQDTFGFKPEVEVEIVE